MNSTELIDRLQADITPVSPVRLIQSSARWVIGSFVFVLLLVILFLGLRDLNALDFRSITTLVGFFGLSAFSAYLSLKSAIPGAQLRLSQYGILLVGLLIVFVSFLSEEVWGKQAVPVFTAQEVKCSILLSTLAILPGIFLALSLRRLAPVSCRLTGWLLGLSLASAGGFGLTLHCAKSEPAHLLLWHGLPVALISFLVARSGRLIFRW